MNTLDTTTTRDCIGQVFLIRRFCRELIEWIEDEKEASRLILRQARKLRATTEPILVRRANTLEAKNIHKENVLVGRNVLMAHGRQLLQLATTIDAAVPQSLLLDLLNVNRADRHMVSPGDGIVEIAFIKGLEDSATHRGSDFKQGPLAQAYTLFMSHELAHNEQLKRAAHEHLFGKGGMFEFLPTYQKTASGEMVRQPPKLRLADACDVREG